MFVDSSDTNAKVLPIFVTVDPDRDGPKEIKEYLKGNILVSLRT